MAAWRKRSRRPLRYRLLHTARLVHGGRRRILKIAAAGSASTRYHIPSDQPTRPDDRKAIPGSVNPPPLDPTAGPPSYLGAKTQLGNLPDDHQAAAISPVKEPG